MVEVRTSLIDLMSASNSRRDVSMQGPSVGSGKTTLTTFNMDCLACWKTLWDPAMFEDSKWSSSLSLMLRSEFGSLDWAYSSTKGQADSTAFKMAAAEAGC
jgi:hypothetical protein